MSKIQLLDCTLRDGGYCNDWTFGQDNIHSIINGLLEANIDLIECGYLSNYQERQLLQSDTYQQKLTDIITDATIDFFQTRHQKITNENES